jgi:hypothetical protein
VSGAAGDYSRWDSRLHALMIDVTLMIEDVSLLSMKREATFGIAYSI